MGYPGWSAAKQALLERRLKGAAQAALPVIGKRPDCCLAPLSSAQQQMMVIDQMAPGNPAYNLPNAFRLRGALDVTALERSFNEVVKRHEILRTTFGIWNDQPGQRIHGECRIDITLTRLDHLEQGKREQTLHALASHESVTSFDLTRLPLMRVALFRLDPTEHVLLINLHHIVADGLSVGLLLDELDMFYSALAAGSPRRLEPLAVQYPDFAYWQRHTTTNRTASSAQLDFWRATLTPPLPVLELPADRPRPPLQSFRGANAYFTIPSTLAGKLRQVGAEEGCTPFMTLLAAFQALLLRFSGETDLVIGTPVSMRTLAEIEPLVGNFLNMVPLRGDLSGNPTFREVLRRSRDITLGAFSNSELPFETLTTELNFQRDSNRNPVFQVMLQMLPKASLRLGDLQIEPFHFDLGFAQLDLSLHVYEQDDGYVGRFEYCTDLFEASTIRRLSSGFVRLLEAAVQTPDERIGRLSILEPAEAHQILYEWNPPKAAFPSALLVHQLVEVTAASAPDHLAVDSNDGSLSYLALERRANRIARALRARGVGRGQRVAICLARGADLPAALLGILKTGAAYLPLDPLAPPERLRYMMDDADTAVLVSTSAQAGLCGLPRNRQLLLDHDARAIESMSTAPLPPDDLTARPEDPAYLIYTSGSTGEPKAVVIQHRSVVNFLASMASEPGLEPDDVLVAVTTLSFDIAVLELFLPLTVGGRIVLATADEATDGVLLRSLLERYGATAMQATPVTWRMLLESGWTAARPFKALVGGESLSTDLAERLIERGAEVWNMYGPTETTVWSTCGRIREFSTGISIGKPIRNTVVRILDADLNLCPVGVSGELCIGGEGVSPGYWRRPELTAERFIVDPFAMAPGMRLYRTGDRARWRKDGSLQHLGRLDFQIKLRGCRIEPGEIEAGLEKHPAIREAAVIAHKDARGDERLVAYLVAQDPPADLFDQLRATVRTAMPEYMVPAEFVLIEAMPLTANAKVDRKALAVIDPRRASRSEPVAARTPTEAIVLGVFREVLGRDDLGVLDNFFDCGGHSLMAVRIVLRLRIATGCDLSRRALFERQTAAGVAETIDALDWLSASSQPPTAGGGARMEFEL